MKKNDFSNIQNPFETKSKIMNNNIITNDNIINNNNINNNNLSKNNFNNSNINNYSFLNPINNENNKINSQINNNNINNNINNNGFLPKTNNLFNSWNLTQNSNSTLNNNLLNNNPNSLSNTLGNPFTNSKQNNINNTNSINNQFNPTINLFNKFNSNCNNLQNNIYTNQNNNNINNYNRPIQNQLIKIERNVTGYQIIPNNIKYKSLLDIQNIGNQNLNISPKLNLSTNQDFCINLYNINSSGTQACQTTSKPKSDLINYINIIKKKYPITRQDQMKFIKNNLQTIIEDFYGNKIILTYEKLIEIQKARNNNDIKDEYNIVEKERKDNVNDLINQGEYLNIKFPYFDYKKGLEIKDSNTQSKDDKLSVNEERNERYKYNPSFEQLYYNHDFSDVILKLNDNIIQAHKVVLASSSKVFMELIKSSEEEFKYNMNNNGTNIIEVLLPENYYQKILILKYSMK